MSKTSRSDRYLACLQKFLAVFVVYYFSVLVIRSLYYHDLRFWIARCGCILFSIYSVSFISLKKVTLDIYIYL